jgi:hypothetical protein
MLYSDKTVFKNKIKYEYSNYHHKYKKLITKVLQLHQILFIINFLPGSNLLNNFMRLLNVPIY